MIYKSKHDLTYHSHILVTSVIGTENPNVSIEFLNGKSSKTRQESNLKLPLPLRKYSVRTGEWGNPFLRTSKL